MGKGENAGSQQDDKVNVIENWKSVLGRIENIIGKGEMHSGSKKFQNFYLSYCHFALVQQSDKEG